MSDEIDELSLESRISFPVDPVRPLPEREGLPRSYRMRADAHYVDQLAATSGQPIRMVSTAQLDSVDVPSENDLRPLIESIRVHGIIQPLVVRRNGSRYTVVAGRKRFASAQMLQLASVPCLVRDIAESDVAALEAADNLRVINPDKSEYDGHALSAVDLAIGEHLVAVRKLAEASTGSDALFARGTMDLLRAHAWRADRLLAAARLVRNLSLPPDDRSVGAIIDSVVDGFLPECRLSDVSIRSEINETLPSRGMNGAQLSAGIAGAIMAMLALVRHAPRPSVVVRASGSSNGSVTCEVVQLEAPHSANLASNFLASAELMIHTGGAAAGIGIRAAMALAEHHAGHVKFDRADHGSRLSIVLMRQI